MPKHTVVVGNIGTVVSEGSWRDANEAFLQYRKQSREGYGRAAGEDVEWFKDGDLYKLYGGELGRSAKHE